MAALAPAVLEAIRRQLGVSNRVLDTPVTEIGLKSPRVVPVIRQRETAGVTQHVIREEVRRPLLCLRVKGRRVSAPCKG